MWKFWEKQPFFRADMAGLGKYSMGGYGRIGVHRAILNITQNTYTQRIIVKNVFFVLLGST